MLKVEIQSAPSMARILCSGRIVLGVEAETLRCMAASRTEPGVVIDLRQVSAMDAAGLGLLVELYCRAQEQAASLTVANLSPLVGRIMALTRLDAILQTAAAEDGENDNHNLTEDKRRAMTA
jgi:anti-anti-sigma factor